MDFLQNMRVRLPSGIYLDWLRLFRKVKNFEEGSYFTSMEQEQLDGCVTPWGVTEKGLEILERIDSLLPNILDGN